MNYTKKKKSITKNKDENAQPAKVENNGEKKGIIRKDF